ncbi:MAG TPA: antibiotic biosynthesis monooxygenase [Candidatus Dormibacteraeota bacterium]|jgi:heme-degrading monooxygenase HmoA|nr:antibiotic biosynthesis monooxygenase [Candidatus Dormibacteraeota bacterium]
MSVLHVDLRTREGAATALLETFRTRFRPAIAQQPGFRSVTLLMGDEVPHRLVIVFEQEEQRLAWVASALHQEVWPQVEAHCESYLPVLFEEVS